MGGALLIMLVLVSQGRAQAPSPSPPPVPVVLPSQAPTDTSSSTTTEPEPTGSKKFGDRCNSTDECGFRGSVCDPTKKSCQCKPDLPATNHIDKCGAEVEINGTCFFNEQCESRVHQTECKDGRCTCRFEMIPVNNKFNNIECIAHYEPPAPTTYVDPTMIGVLVGMALMFIIICVVLRLFSKARWRDNRTIFNTPNPRLMNVSLLRETKPPERRGSKGSNTRAPSRQPSIASLRPQSPAQSQGSSRGSVRSSGSGATRSPTHHPQTNTGQQSQQQQHPNNTNSIA